MTEVQSWLVTTGVFTLIFCIGLYFKKQEKQDRLVKKVEDAIAAETQPLAPIPLYAASPRQNRRGGVKDRRQPATSSPANAVSQRR